MNIEVRGKEFKIELINNWCSRKYHEELFPMIVEHGGILEDGIKTAAAAIAEKTGKERAAETRKQAEILKKNRERAEELDELVYNMRFELIQELLESNDIEYDRRWWERRTCPEDVNEFILCCLQPEYQTVKEKNKKKARSK